MYTDKSNSTHKSCIKINGSSIVSLEANNRDPLISQAIPNINYILIFFKLEKQNYKQSCQRIFHEFSWKISTDLSRFPRKQILFSTSLPVPLALALFCSTLLFIGKRYLWHAIRHRCVRHCEDWKNIFALKPMESVTWIPEIGLLFTWTRMVDFYSGR